MKTKKIKFSGTEWTKDDLVKGWDLIAKIAKDKYGLDWYEPQYEIVNEEMMIQACTTHALPTLYDHWSFGKDYIETEKAVIAGKQNLAYEVIINSNPSVCYLMASNSLLMMLCVMAHAAVGHSNFFKNNYLFKEWTNANTVLPFCTAAKTYIKECEDKYGYKEVEALIDALHAVGNISYDKKPKPTPVSKKHLETMRQISQEKDRTSANSFFDYLFYYLHEKDSQGNTPESSDVIVKEDNILRVFRQYAGLPEWKNKIIDIFIYINQYFYPQIQVKMSNEGWASFWDYTLVKDLYDGGHITEGMYLEFLNDHGGVGYQSKFSQFNEKGKAYVNPYYRSINPYFLGYNIYKEIRRVCEEQDEESLQAVPSLRGKDWIEACKDAMANYRDDSLIHQFLTPNLARQLKPAFVTYGDQVFEGRLMHARKIELDHDDDSFKELRGKLAQSYSIGSRIPTITSHVNLGKRSDQHVIPELNLVYTPLHDMELYPKYFTMVKNYIKYIWQGPVKFTKEGAK